MTTLDDLMSEDILEIGVFASSAQGLASLLRARPEVRELRKLIAIQSIDGSQLRTWVTSLFDRVQYGRRSIFDVSLAALAVALERQPGQFADEFLRGLAGLRLAELPLSPRVARLSLVVRARALAPRTERHFRLSQGDRPEFSVELVGIERKESARSDHSFALAV